MNKNTVLQFGSIAALLVALCFLPHYLKYHYQDFLIFLTINVLVVVSYRIVTLTGEWSLIHAVMMGVGAYSSAMLSKFWGVPFWFALPLAGLIAGLISALLCYPLFRMTQFYFLIGSFAAGEAIRLSWIYFIKPFGGTGGISGIPSPELGSIDFLEPIPYFYLVLTIVVVCLLVLYRIEKSRIGLTLHAVHWKAPLAESVGVNTWKYRSLAFIIGSFFVGMAGSLKVHYLGTVSPNQFDIGFMVFILIWVIVGGYSTFYGAILGAIVLSILDESFRQFEEIRPAIYGLILILAILYLPKGLESIPKSLGDWRTRRNIMAKSK
ncbi:MAG: branched-chain amino acid ABC transporter permease [Methyloligellaceae bacterium]